MKIIIEKIANGYLITNKDGTTFYCKDYRELVSRLLNIVGEAYVTDEVDVTIQKRSY